MRTCLMLLAMCVLSVNHMALGDTPSTQPSEVTTERIAIQATTQPVVKPAPYHLYWLSSKELGEYVVLLISQKPVGQLSGVKFKSTKELPEATAIVVTTYASDSIWNVDMRPFTQVESVEHVDLDKQEMVLNDKRYQYVHASLADVIALFANPAGTVPIHRIYAPLAGSEAISESLLVRLKAQLAAEEDKMSEVR